MARTDRARDGLAIAALGALGAWVFGPAVFGDEAFFARDVLHYYWPMREAAAEAFARWRLPLWDDGSMAGLPLLANLHAGVLYPPNLLHQLLSFPRAYAALLWAHQWLGAAGVFLAARQLGLGRLPAWVGAAAFALGGAVLSLVHAGPLLYAAAWLPWVLLVLERELPPLRRALLLALLVTLQTLSGDPQSVLFSGVLIAVWLAWSPQRRARLGAVAGGFAFAGAWSAVQLVPALFLLGQSTRGEDRARFASDWAFHPLRLLELAFPFPLGRYTEAPEFWAQFAVQGPGRQPFALSVCLGTAVVLLAVAGARRDRLTGFALTLGGLGLVLALGAHGPAGALLRFVPPFNLFRYPEKYVLLVALAVALLAARGLASALDANAGWRRLLAPGATWAAALIALGVLQLAGGRLPAGALPALSASLLHGTIAGGLLLTALALNVRLRRPAAIGGAVAALAVVELLLIGAEVTWTAPRLLFTEEPPVVAAVKALRPHPHARFIRHNPSLAGAPAGSSELETYVLGRGWDVATLKSNLGTVFGLQEVTGYGAVNLQRWARAGPALLPRPERLAQVFDGCVLLSGPGSRAFADPARFLPAEVAPPGVAVAVARECPGRLFAVEELRAADSPEQALRMVADPSLELSRVAVVEGAVSGHFAAARVRELELVPGRLRARLDAPAGAAFLVFATSWYPGWEARVDGEEVPLLPVNGAVMGFPVPPGARDVEVRFREPGLGVGGPVTLAGLLAALGLWVRGRFSRGDRTPAR